MLCKMTKDYTHLDAVMRPVTELRVGDKVPFAEGYKHFKDRLVLFTLSIPYLNAVTIENIAKIEGSLAIAQRHLELATVADQDPTISQGTMLSAFRSYTKHQVPRELWGPGKHMAAFRAALIQFYGPQSTVIVPGYTQQTSQTQDDKFVTTVEPIAQQDQSQLTALLRQQGLLGKIHFWN